MCLGIFYQSLKKTVTSSNHGLIRVTLMFFQSKNLDQGLQFLVEMRSIHLLTTYHWKATPNAPGPAWAPNAGPSWAMNCLSEGASSFRDSSSSAA